MSITGTPVPSSAVNDFQLVDSYGIALTTCPTAFATGQSFYDGTAYKTTTSCNAGVVTFADNVGCQVPGGGLQLIVTADNPACAANPSLCRWNTDPTKGTAAAFGCIAQSEATTGYWKGVNCTDANHTCIPTADTTAYSSVADCNKHCAGPPGTCTNAVGITANTGVCIAGVRAPTKTDGCPGMGCTGFPGGTVTGQDACNVGFHPEASDPAGCNSGKCVCQMSLPGPWGPIIKCGDCKGDWIEQSHNACTCAPD